MWKRHYAGMLTTLRSRDLASFKMYFAPEFMAFNPKGESLDRNGLMKEVSGLLQGAKKVNAMVDVQKVHKMGDMVHVDFDFHMSAWKKKGTMKVHEAGVDTWKKIDGKWMCIKTVDRVLMIK